mmetsp:Transcript_4272/g.15365  ORF Transcript_4272/g.15365 Transcript_4272/m.15365 type:complete len:1910 (+) Transcript_4272:127-5856(+)
MAFGGGFNSSSPFGQNSAFGAKPAGAFGQQSSPFQSGSAAGAFGSSSGGGLFGQQNQSSPGGFGQQNTSVFGQQGQNQSRPLGFGQTQNNAFGGGGGLFGSQASQPAFGGGSTFGQTQQANPFGGSSTTSAFGQTSAFGGTQTSTFGQQQTSPAFGSSTASPFGQNTSAFGSTQNTSPGAFGTGGAFGGGAATGTRQVAYQPTQDQDSSTSGGGSQIIKFQSIVLMPQYNTKSVEELRWEDYQNNDKGGPKQGGAFGSSPGFGASPATSAFGTGASTPFGQQSASTNLFGQSSSPAFGAAQSSPSLFGGATSGTGAFGGGTSLFGQASQPAFGASSAPAFGAPASTPAFGSSGFGALGASQPAAAQPFGTAASTPAFGASSTPAFGAGSAPAFGAPAGGTSLFGAPTLGATPGAGASAFGAQSTPAFGTTSTPAFGATPTPAFGGSTGLFGASATTPATPGGSLFGAPAQPSAFGSTFGAKPQTATASPAFPFTPQSSPGGLFGSTTGTSFGLQPQQQQGTGLFGAQPAASTLSPAAQAAPVTPLSPTASPFGTMPQIPQVAGAAMQGATTPTTVPSLSKSTSSGQTPVLVTPRRITPKSSMRIRVRRTPGIPATRTSPQAATQDGFFSSATYVPPASDLLQQRDNPRSLFIKNATPPPIADKSNGASPKPFLRVAGGETMAETPTKLMNGHDGSLRRSPASSPPELSLRMDSPLHTPGKEVSSAEPVLSFHGNPLYDAPQIPSLDRPEYEMDPSPEELAELARATPGALARVQEFCVRKKHEGSVQWVEPTNVNGLDLDRIIRFTRGKEGKATVEVYFDESIAKPAVGQGLNKRAIVTLHNIYKIDKKSGERVTSGPLLDKFVERTLKGVGGTTFLGYDPDTENGTWRFEVEHFSKWGLEDSDEEEEESHNQDDGGQGGDEGHGQGRSSSGPPEQGPQASEARNFMQDNPVFDRLEGKGATARLPARSLRSHGAEVEDSAELRLGVQGSLLPAATAGALPHTLPAQLGLQPQQVEDFREAFFESPGPVVRERSLDRTPFAMQNVAFGTPIRPLPSTNSLHPMPFPKSATPGRTPTRTLDPPVEATPRRGAAALTPAKVLSRAAAGPSGCVVRKPDRTFSESLQGSLVRRSELGDSSYSAVVDAAVVLGHSSRVGWGPGGMFVHALSRVSQSESEVVRLTSRVHLQRIVYDPLLERRQEREQNDRYEAWLDVSLRNSLDSACGEASPHWQMQCSPITLPEICGQYLKACGDVIQSAGSQEGSEYRHQVMSFHLLDTLYSPIGEVQRAQSTEDMAGTDAMEVEGGIADGQNPGSFVNDMQEDSVRRRARVSWWLQQYAKKGSEQELAEEKLDFAALVVLANKALDLQGSSASGESHALAMRLQAAGVRRWRDVLKLVEQSVRLEDYLGVSADLASALQAAVCSQSVIRATDETAYLRSVWAALTARNLEEACKQAITSGDVRLGLMISQAVALSSGPQALRTQLSQWKDARIAQSIHLERMRIMYLLAGDVRNALLDGIEIDWRRRLGLWLWYGLPATAPLKTINEMFLLELEEQTSPRPLPLYAEGVKLVPHDDVCFHIYQLFCKVRYDQASMRAMFMPGTSTDNLLDSRLSWHLYTLLRAMSGVLDDGEDSALFHLHSDFAAQLEAAGMIEWAVYALLHLPAKGSYKDPRAGAVKSLLARNVEVWSSEERETFLLEALHVPFVWLYEAKAELAGYHKDWNTMLECLLLSELWGRAHEVLMVAVAPLAFLGGRHVDLQRFIGLLKPHAEELQNWVLGGRVLDDYYSIMQAFSEAVDIAEDLVSPPDREAACKSLCSRLEGAARHWERSDSLQFPDRGPLLRAMYNQMGKNVLEGLISNHRKSLASGEVASLYNAHKVALQTSLVDDEKACRLREAATHFVQWAAQPSTA